MKKKFIKTICKLSVFVFAVTLSFNKVIFADENYILYEQRSKEESELL